MEPCAFPFYCPSKAACLPPSRVGPCVGPHCRGWHHPSAQAPGTELALPVWEALHGEMPSPPFVSLTEGAGNGCKASSRQGINCSCVEML